MITHGLSCSVGNNGTNLYDDTKVVQALLNSEMRRNAPFASSTKGALDADGKCGPLTIGAITAFQSTVMGWGDAACDGRVDPGGKTWTRLNGNVAGPNAIRPAPLTREVFGAVAASAGFSDFTFDPPWDSWHPPMALPDNRPGGMLSTAGALAAPAAAQAKATNGTATPVKQGNYKQTLGHGTLTISGYGCALCSLTMAANMIGSRTRHWPKDLTPADLTPLKANEIIKKAGGFSGSLLIMTTAARALGMSPQEYGHSVGDALPAPDNAYDQIVAHLRHNPVAVYVDYKGGAAGDHWVVLTSVSGQTINALDPATGKSMTFGADKTGDRTRTENNKKAAMFGTSGSQNQKNYAIVRYILLSPVLAKTIQ